MDSRQWWKQAYHGPMAVSPGLPPSDFAVELCDFLPRPSRVLELGCGSGEDSAYISRRGHWVLASDFVPQDRAWRHARAASPSLTFMLLDMRTTFPFRGAMFDVVYARLSLHYFSDEVSKRIFGEIHRVLAPHGLLAFLCKSTGDPLYGRGEQVGPDMFRLYGKVRHFFDEDFARACLSDRFIVEDFWSGPAETYGEQSDVVRVWARKGDGRLR